MLGGGLMLTLPAMLGQSWDTIALVAAVGLMFAYGGVTGLRDQRFEDIVFDQSRCVMTRRSHLYCLVPEQLEETQLDLVARCTVGIEMNTTRGHGGATNPGPGRGDTSTTVHATAMLQMEDGSSVPLLQGGEGGDAGSCNMPLWLGFCWDPAAHERALANKVNAFLGAERVQPQTLLQHMSQKGEAVFDQARAEMAHGAAGEEAGYVVPNGAALGLHENESATLVMK